MKKAYIYLTCIGMAVLAVACSKNESLMAPDKKETAQEAKIGFGSVMARASDAPVADESEPLQIQVYDYFTPTGGSEGKYIDEYIQRAESGDAWAFVKEHEDNEYAWKKGTHKFFGWVFTDDGTNSLPGISYAEEDKVVTFSGSNVDYRYSDLVSVDWPNNSMIVTDGDKKTVKPVNLELHHLTAALKLKVTNKMTTAQTVAVSSVKLKNIVTASSATVDYSGTVADHEGKAVVTYSEEGTVGELSLPAIPSTTLEADKDVVATAMAYVWPQLVNNVAASDETEGEGSETEPAVAATVEVTYTLGGTSNTTTMTLPATEWEAGNCYTLNLQIVNKGIELTFTVLPWESVAVGTIDTSVGSINMTNVTWMNTKLFVNGELKNTLNNSAYSVFMYKDGYLPKVDGNGEVITEKYTEEVTETYQEDVYDTYAETVYDLYTEDVYDTYLEDVIDPDTGEVIHAAGEVKVYEETILDPDTGNPIQTAGDPIILHKKGDKKLDENNNPIILHEAGEIKTYEADVKDPETGEIIHHAGDQILLHEAGTPVLDEYGRPIVHHVGDVKYGPDGEPIYQVGEKKEGYCPAQGFFTVNYPKEGLFKIDLIPAYGQSEADLDKSKYDIYIYDYPTETAGGTFRSINPDGEPISNNTVYFQVRAADGQDGAEYKAQINIWFKFAEYDEETEKWVIPEDAEWISAYSEIRANYALIIPATN